MTLPIREDDHIVVRREHCGMDRSSDPFARRYAADLSSLLGDRLKELWLFGSRARGDNSEESDYDILLVVDADRREIQDAVGEENHLMLDEFSQLFGCIIYTPQTWAIASAGPLGMNNRKGGLRLV